MTGTAALEGLRVLDLADESGAYCGKLLADMGADVILIEPPGGARMRTIGPFHRGVRHPDRSLFFWHYNTNKRSISLDVRTAAGRRRFMALVAGADVVIDTSRPGQLDDLGLGYAALATCNPRVILASITPFGQSGPCRTHRGSDLICQALGGMVFVNGWPDEPPVQGLGLQAYHSAALHAAIAIMLALMARTRTGRGQQIDLSIQASVAACVEHASATYHTTGAVAHRQGTLHWTRHFRVGRCRDGDVLHGTLGDWTALLEWVKADGMAADLDAPVWTDAGYRRDHSEHLFTVLDAWARTYAVADLVSGAQLRRLPYAAVRPPDTLCSDPQLRARGFFAAIEHDDLGESLTYPGAPYVFSATPWRLRQRPPRLGEHTAAVLAAAADCASGPPPRRLGAARAPAPGMRPLDGIRVIDFTWVAAGPVATRILADHGADVIKIERPDTPVPPDGPGGVLGNLNRGKRSIVLDLNTADGIDVARRLLAHADVVVDNFSPRVLPNWGLDWPALHALNPRLVAVSMSGFGHSGPQRDHVSFGPTLQALAGFTYLMRHPGGAAAGWGFSYSDMAAGLYAALAVLLALRHRERSGRGQWIDLSQFEALATLVGPVLLDLLTHGGVAAAEASAADHGTSWAALRDAGGLGNRSQERPAAPHGVYRCADAPPGRERWCALAVFDEDEWSRFCAVLDHPPWTRDPRFASHVGRLRHSPELDAHVSAWTRERAAAPTVHLLQNAGVAAGIVADAEDLCRHDPQLRARGYWVRVCTPDGREVTLDGTPFVLSDTPARIERPAPRPGEDTDAVLRGVLEMDHTTIAALRRSGAIG